MESPEPAGTMKQAKERMSPMSFDDYEILGRLDGACGRYLAWRSLPACARGHYTLHCLPDDRTADPEYRRRLVLEAEAGALVDHPTLARVHEVLIDGDRAAVVTDHVDGVSLHDVLVRREAAHDPVAQGPALELAARLLDAAGHLHGLRGPDGTACFHGRITPANVMLTIDGGVKLCGFGIASDLPERRSGERLGPAADQYAVALILLGMILGRRIAIDHCLQPARGRCPATLLRALRELDLRDPATPVLLRMLATAAEDRYASAAEASGEVMRVRFRLPGSQALPSFAAAEVERVRGDVAAETEPSADGRPSLRPSCALRSAPADEWGPGAEPSSEWLCDIELDEDLALTAAGSHMQVSPTLPFARGFVPRASQWWTFDGEEEIARTEPLGHLDPPLLEHAETPDASQTVPFGRAHTAASSGTRPVPSWVFGADTIPIPGCAAATLPWPAPGPGPRPQRRSAPQGVQSLPGAEAKARRRRQRAGSTRRGDPAGSGLVRRFESEGVLEKSSVARWILAVVLLSAAVALAQGLRADASDGTGPADPRQAEAAVLPID